MMMYLNYIVSNNIRYNKCLGILTFLASFCVLLLLVQYNKKSLDSLDSKFVELLNCEIVEIERKSKATYSNHLIKEKCLVIQTLNEKFILGSQFNEYRDSLSKSLVKGDKLKIYYKIDTENQLMPIQIERGLEILFPFSYFKKKGFVFLAIVILILTLTIGLLILLVVYRIRNIH